MVAKPCMTMAWNEEEHETTKLHTTRLTTRSRKILLFYCSSPS